MDRLLLLRDLGLLKEVVGCQSLVSDVSADKFLTIGAEVKEALSRPWISWIALLARPLAAPDTGHHGGVGPLVVVDVVTGLAELWHQLLQPVEDHHSQTILGQLGYVLMVNVILILQPGESLGQLVPGLVVQALVALIPGLTHFYLQDGLLYLLVVLTVEAQVDQHLLRGHRRLVSGGCRHLGKVLRKNLF